MTDNNKTMQNDARNSFTGKTLTDSQYDESWALAEIMQRSIRKSGTFHEKLTDYAHAFARGDKFDQIKGETIIRDQFKSRYGETMNQMRLGLKEREENLPEAAQVDAVEYARMIEPLIRDGDTMPFYRAYDYVGGALAEKLNITETGAKSFIKDAFHKAEGREFYEVGKELEAQFHQPKRDAERAARQTERKPTRSQNYQR